MRHIGRKIDAFVAGELNEDERQSVLDHLAECPECAAQEAQARRVWDLLAPVAGRQGTSAPSAWPQIQARTFGRGRGSRFGGGRRWGAVTAATMAWAAGVGLAILIPIGHGDGTNLASGEETAWGSAFWLEEQAETTFSELWLVAVDEGSES